MVFYLVTSKEHDCVIQCEVCYKIFSTPDIYNRIIDADGFDYAAKGIEEGLCNRAACPHCHIEFTVENPLLIYSWKHKVYAASYLCNMIFDAANLENALKISGASDVTLRKTNFALEAAEKINIARFELNDIKIEKFKTIKFPQYISMKSNVETIVFDRIENDFMIFTHRHFTDSVISNFFVPLDEYNNFEFEIPDVPKGTWIKIDKNWILKNTEAKNEF